MKYRTNEIGWMRYCSRKLSDESGINDVVDTCSKSNRGSNRNTAVVREFPNLSDYISELNIKRSMEVMGIEPPQ